jgi:general secretion pathway protein D
MVTQIIPIRYMDATKLIENLRPLLSADATINANESSNAILLTDTETNIHRMTEIIHALDTSVSSISAIRVFPLRYADAKDFASVLTQLFSPETSGTNGQNQGGPGAFFGRFGGGGGGRGGGGGGGGGEAAAPESEARKAASRVVAVADAQSNSVVVSAPEEYMDTIADIVSRLDTSTTDVTETRIFRLDHADSMELSTILNSLYGDSTTTAGAGGRTGGQGQNGRNGGNGGNGGNGNRPVVIYPNAQPAAGPSDRSLLQARMVAVPDPRTNSIIVNCSHDTMEQVALTIGRLDTTDAKKQHVYVEFLQNADPDNLATILRGMFGGQNVSTTGAQPTSSALNQRTVNGASSDVTGTLNTSSTGNNGGR